MEQTTRPSSRLVAMVIGSKYSMSWITSSVEHNEKSFFDFTLGTALTQNATQVRTAEDAHKAAALSLHPLVIATIRTGHRYRPNHWYRSET